MELTHFHVATEGSHLIESGKFDLVNSQLLNKLLLGFVKKVLDRRVENSASKNAIPIYIYKTNLLYLWYACIIIYKFGIKLIFIF